MSTPKTVATSGQSCAASHAAVIHRHIPSAADPPFGLQGCEKLQTVPLAELTNSRFLLRPNHGHGRELVFPALAHGTIRDPLASSGARPSMVSARLSRRVTAKRSPSLQWKSSTACCTRRVEMAKEAGPRAQLVITTTIQLLPSWCAHGIEAGKN
jgi:hypothetical protein